jgi:N-formylglutamate amidohydrolase
VTARFLIQPDHKVLCGVEPADSRGDTAHAPLILHIPHSSPLIPPAERASLLPDDRTLARELLAMTDAWTDRLLADLRLPASRLVFPVSRLVVDVERFPDDADEPMAAKGMGPVYTRLSTGARLRDDDPAERERLMNRWYHPHHAALSQLVQGALDDNGRPLIIDVHSFPSHPLPYELDQTPERPEICIGTDPYHSPFANDGVVRAIGEEAGFVTALNRPFAGSIVPAAYWRSDRRVRSLMIEVRRDLYMDEATGEPLREFDRVVERICRLLEALVAAAV